MAWEQLSINKPHLAYLILGGFTSLFMLVSLFVKEKLYIGEATVATLCGVIFGPHAANLFNPASWGNVDQITLECSRVVLVVQCFAVGVELPKAYMERHWKSVVFLLVPVMTFGWLITSLFVWWLIEPLTWLEALVCAACVTATDPVLASSVVGKGKFAKRVPKHLRDVLSAESGCNDGMAFPFIYLSFYLLHYHIEAKHTVYHWICNTILYECVFGAVYGVLIGYIGRHMIKWADRRGLIDRESFLVFYFVLALFCAGTGATLGTDDLLVGFAAGVGFSNDGWFTHKTEESHVSNVIDLLLNLAYFVYLGSIIPWEQYNAPSIGLTPWRLAVIAILVILFRRIPIMMALKPLIPDVKTWREALFAGHFGPIGVGAIFAAILARAELETDSTTPLRVLDENPESENYMIIHIIWPLTTFLVITSILVHGSSIAVFTLGKRINTLTLTMSYTQANEEGPSWMNRLPRIQSTARSSMSKGKDDFSTDSSNEKLPDYPPGTLPPIGVPGNFLRRQKEEDTPIEGRRSAPSAPKRRKSKWDAGMGPGGPVSESAIRPQRKAQGPPAEDSVSDTLLEKGGSSSDSREDESPDAIEMRDEIGKEEAERDKEPHKVDEPELEAYEEGDEMVIEDEEGNIVSMNNVKGETEHQKRQHVLDAEQKLRRDAKGVFAKGKNHPHEENEGEEMEEAIEHVAVHPEQSARKFRQRFEGWNPWVKKDKEGDSSRPQEPKELKEPKEPLPPEHKRGPAHAYQFGNTIIVEDEDGEVIKKYDIPAAPKRVKTGRGGVQDGPGHFNTKPLRQGLNRKLSAFTGRARSDSDVHEENPTPVPIPVEEAEANAPSAQADTKEKRPSVWRRKASAIKPEDPDDNRIRFTIGDGGRRMSKQDFIQEIRQLDPKARVEALDDSNAPQHVKEEAHRAGALEDKQQHRPSDIRGQSSKRFQPMQSAIPEVEDRSLRPTGDGSTGLAPFRLDTKDDTSTTDSETEDRSLRKTGTNVSAAEIPTHSVPQSLARYSTHGPESAAQRRRRLAGQGSNQDEDSEDDNTERIPPAERRRRDAAARQATGATPSSSQSPHHRPQATGRGRTTSSAAEETAGETAAERRRRLAALGEAPEDKEESSDSEDDNTERKPRKGHEPVGEPGRERPRGIRFEETPSASQANRRLQWGEDVGKKKK